MSTDGKLHNVPCVQCSFSDNSTVLPESVEWAVNVIADSVDSAFSTTIILREEKHVIRFPTSVIALGYLTLEYQRDQVAHDTFWYLLFVVSCCLKNFLRWPSWSIVTLEEIQDSTVLRTSSSMYKEWYKCVPNTCNIYFTSGYSTDHMDFALDRSLLTDIPCNGAIFVPKVWKAVL